MNKKFLSAIMCGAMLTASTSVFVSCEDYGDDIAHLQTQIDQNAATAASELAGKVAALEGQISTLKAAQDNMKDQLVEAKAAAAAAANEAAAAAAKAQATADAAQSGAADAKAAAAAAQAAADAANKGLADAVARVAVLETKVASLEATIAGLTASDKELSAKLNDLQVLANSLKNATDANTEEIKAIKAEIAAKTAELAGQVAKISAEFGAKIDAVSAELNTIKANYATKNELNEKAAELAAIDATLAEQIAANEAYIAAMQEAIAALEAEDAELAALIAENQAAALAQIEATNEELAAQKEAVEAELATINEKIDEVNGALEQLVMAVMGNKSALEDFQVAVETVVTDMQGQISQLILQANGNYEAIVAIMENLDNLNTAAGDMQGQIESLIKQTGANYDEIVKILEALEEQAGWNKDIQTIIVNLQESYLTNDGILEGLINDLKAVVEGQGADIKALQEWTAAYDAKYAEFVKAQEEAIAAELAKLENISAGLLAAQADIAELQGQVESINKLITGLHSVVFVPQYAMGNFDLSVYHINTYVWNASQKKVVDGADVFPVGTAKFRVEPAGYAAKLAAAYERDNNFIKLESSDELVKTRAAQSLLKVVSAKADGDFLLVGYTKNGAVADGYYPTALVVSASDTTLSRTSDYFRMKFATEQDDKVVNGLLQTGEGKGAAFKAYTEGTRNALNETSNAEVKLLHNVFEAYNIKTALRTELFNADAATVLPYDGKIASNLRIVNVNGQALKNGQWSNAFFTVKENGEVSVNSDKGIAVKNNVGQEIVVRVADDTYELQSDGVNYADYVDYLVTFVIAENLYENTLTFNYAMTWPATTAAAQKITVASIAADANGLATYKLDAADVFKSLFNMVGTDGVTYTEGAYSITMVAVDTDNEDYITVTPNVALTQNYHKDVNNWKAASYKDNALCSLININVNFDFSVPGVTDFFNKIKMYWGGEGDNTLEVDYTLKESETKDEYTYEVDMNKVYLFNNWTPATVDYSWSIDKADNVLSYDGISFTPDGELQITGPISVIYKNGTIKPVNVADLTFTATAKNNGNVLAQQPAQKFNVTYPINVNDIKNPNNVVFKYSDLKAGKKFDATSAVSLKDIDGYTWIHNGAILTADANGLISVAEAWKIENLQYEVINVSSAGQNLTAENLITIAPAGGELVINKPANITKRAEVTIKMSFDYKYEKGIATTYTVIVDPTL